MSSNDGDVTMAKGRTKRSRETELAPARSWGPFTGRQLTTIICVGMATVLFPVGAWAVVNQNVAITDPGGVNRAKVNANGQLNVSGAAIPATSYNNVKTITEAGTGGCENVTPAVPAGKALVVTSITANSFSVTTGPVFVIVEQGTPAEACPSLRFLNVSQLAGAGSTEFIPFPSGLVFKAGHTVSVAMQSSSGNAALYVTVNGYFVPSTQCQTVAGGPAGCY